MPREKRPRQCKYQIAGDRVRVAFAYAPNVAVRQIFKDTPNTHYDVPKALWNAPLSEWPRITAALVAFGFTVEETEFAVVGRRERQAIEAARVEAAHNEAMAAAGPDGLTLANFDWSGYPAWAEKNLTIKDKRTGGLIPFKCNGGQLRLFEKMKDQWRRRGMIRIAIVKSRQIGFSTFIQGFCFYLALHVPALEGLITAHREDAALAVFRRTKIFELRCPEKKELQLNSRRELQWKHPHLSALRVGVAGGDDGFGRSDTRHVYHGSESAHYNKAGIEAMGNIESSVPKSPGTCIWYETTANGKNHFWESYRNAAISGFETHFEGSIDDPSCRVYGVALDDERWRTVPVEWKEDEPRLRRIAKEKGLPEEEIVAYLCFRRQTIASPECRGLPVIFMREYPAIENDAFTATGCSAFPTSVVEREWERCLDAERLKPAPTFRCDRSVRKVVPDPWGWLRIWKKPEDGVSYVIAGDFASGKNVAGEGGDESKRDATTFVVVNEYTREEVAVWYGRMDPDLAAEEMAILGCFYNDATLCPETNNHGMIVVNKLVRQLHYPKVWRKIRLDRPTATPIRQDPESIHALEYGFWTGTTLAKDTMVSWLNEAIRDGTVTFHEPEFWDECRTFVIDEHGDAGAESGKHDDRVMARAIICSVLRLSPKTRPQEVAKAKPAMFTRAWVEQKMAAARRRVTGGGGEHYN